MSEKLSNKEQKIRNNIKRAQETLARKNAGKLISGAEKKNLQKMMDEYPEEFENKLSAIDNSNSLENIQQVIEVGESRMKNEQGNTQANINKEKGNIESKGLDNTNETTEALETINQANESATTEQDAVINAAQNEVKTVVGDSNVENSNETNLEVLTEVSELTSRLDKAQEEFDKEQKNIENLQVAIQEEEEANSNLKNDLETFPGSNQIKNPKYQQGETLKVIRSNGVLEGNWKVLDTRLENGKRIVKLGNNIDQNGMPVDGSQTKDVEESELERINSTITTNEEKETEDVKVEEAFDSEKAFEEAQGRINTFIDTRAEELKNKIVNGTATGDDFEELDNLENPDKNPKPTEPEDEENKNEENIENLNGQVLNEIEETQKAKKESWISRQKESIANAYKKGEDWWFKEDKKSWEKGLKSAISAGFIGASILGIANLGEYLPKNLNFQNRVTYRALMAGGIGAFLGSEKFKNIIFSTKEKWSEMKPWQRKAVIAVVGITTLVGTGALIATTGVATIGSAGVGILGRLGVDKYYKKDKESKEIEKKELEKRITVLNEKIAEHKSNKNLDQDKLLNFLEQHEKDQKEVEEKIKEVNKKLKNIEIKKSLFKGGASILAGTVGVLVTETAFNQNIRGNVREFFNKNILSEFTSDNIPEKPDTVSTDEIPKQEEQSFWSKAINKIKNFGQGKEGNKNMVKMSKDLDRDMMNRPNTKDITENGNTETNENTPQTENNKGEVENVASDKKGNAEDLKNEEVSEQEDNNGKSEAIDSKKEEQDNNNGESEAKTDNKTGEQNDNSNQKTIKNTEKPTEYKTGDKIDVKNLKPESIIDSQKNVGETYVYRSLIRSDDELAQKLAKYQGLDLEKVNDDRYMANYLRKLAIKLGRMDTEGHEIRYNKEAVDNISLKLDVDKDGKLIAYEIDKAGIVKDVHHEGDTLEKNLESYEETKLKKTYADIEKAYNENSGIVAPEKINGDPFSNSYLMGDDSSEYLENNYSNNQTNTPDDLSNDEIVAPEKINTNYNFENIKTSSDWENLKGNNLRDFFATGKINMSDEEVRVAESLREFYKKALEASSNNEDFMDFVRNNPKLTIEEATNLYKDVVKEGDFTDTLKEKYHFYDWKDSLTPVDMKSPLMREVKDIAKDYYKNKFEEKDLIQIKNTYTRNLENLMFGKELKHSWDEVKDQSVSKYIKQINDPLTDYMKNLEKVTGLKPSDKLFKKEDIDHYIIRATMKAKLDGRLNEIIINSPKTQLNTNLDNDNLDEYRPSKKIGDLKKEFLDEYKPYPGTKQETSKIEDNLNEYKPSKK